MGGGLTFVYNITGSCNCGREWRGRRPIVEWSSIKSDVTKHTFSGNGGRQPPWVFSAPDKWVLPCFPRLPSVPRRAPYLHTLHWCRLLSPHLFDAQEWTRGLLFVKASHVRELFSFPAIKSGYFTGSALQRDKKINRLKKKKKRVEFPGLSFLFTFH